MLVRRMKAVEQWRAIEKQLPDGWEEARLVFTAEDERSTAAAAGVLAPLGPGRTGRELRFHARPSGPASAESVRNLLGRLDRNRIWGELSVVDVRVPEEPEAEVAAPGSPGAARSSLTAAWDELVGSLPPDWTDALCELEVDSTDYLPRAALLGAPLNPTRNPDAHALRFRVGRRGYGASPVMARRCFERMDADRVTGRISVLNELSDVGNVATQGPVWRIAGRSV
jgi:hypothetical protein